MQLGLGGGSSPSAKDGETSSTPEKLPGKAHPGQTVATLLVEGEAPSGEAKAILRQAVKAGSRIAESELKIQRVPASLRQVAQDYFDRLQGRTED
ncbi:MAG: hypothetical protein OSB09_00635 [Planctomycetota bacterium]|nr:hypothetical protein [Planctomycetota bacterium]